jgi:RHS repeat-associated protein
MSSRCSRLNPSLVVLLAVAIALATPVGLQTSDAADQPVAGSEASTLQREAVLTPQEIGDGAAQDLLYADPTENLSQVAPPEGNNTGTAQLDYPLVLPKGRGMTPELALSYESGGGSSWAGLGWDLSVGDISVDTQWGVPLFCPRDTGPKCDNVESESYTLDGEALMPSAVRSGFLPRIAERQDFTRRVETEYEQIIRHGDSPENYFWEVVDKQGARRWYGGYPDEGGPVGAAGTRDADDTDDVDDKRFINDKTRNPGAILTDGADNEGNGYRWYLSAERDVGVNFFRYEYDTVTYESVRETGGDGTAWRKIADDESCASSRTCAKHVYLDKILYTGAGEASGHGEDPAYVVDFVREQGARPDPVMDARGGFLDLDQERLDRVDVRYRDTDELVTRYKLAYSQDRFGKSRLDSITQIGCAGGTATDCDQSTAAKHELEYFNAPAAGSGFAAPVTWDAGGGQAGGDDLDSGHHVNRASALGMSKTNAGDGHVYLGFNPAIMSKNGSFGGSVTLNGGDTNSLVEFIDINGDTLPDKVFKSGGALKYRLNTAKPGDDPTQALSFSGGTAGTITGLATLPRETEFGISGGPEAYFGVFGVFNVGGGWSWADGYFTDANADGLPDYAKDGRVLFNHLDCSSNGGRLTDPSKCVPTFSANDANTRVPLTVDAVPVTDDTGEEALQLARELAPPVDTVRRWVAPFGGRITIGGTAKLLAPPIAGDVASEPVRVAVQHNGAEVASTTLTGINATWTPSIVNRRVEKGERIYFRASSRASGAGDDVQWDPSITYVDFGTGALDANGLRQDLYQASTDFTLAGRPGSVVTLPDAGTARFTAALDKGATSDDVAPRLQVRPRAGGDPRVTAVEIIPLTAAGALDATRVKSVAKDGDEWCVSDPSGGDFGCYSSEADANARLRYIGAAEVGRFGLKADFHVDAEADDKADAVQTWLSVDSPIDVRKIKWLDQPKLCYPDTAGVCDEDKAIVNPHVDIDIYPVNTLVTPAAPWTSTRGEVEKIEVKLDVGANNLAGNVVLTIKKAGGYVHKETFHIGAGGSSRTFTKDDLEGVDLTNGEKYWFDLSVRNPGLSEKLSNPRVTLKWTETEDGTEVEKSVSPPATLHAVGVQSYFAAAYRGWALAGYRSEGTRGTSAVNEADFRPGPADGGTFDDADEACDAQPGGCKTADDVDDMGFDEDYPTDGSGNFQLDTQALKDQTPKVFAYVPTLSVTASSTLEESWQLVDAPPRLMGTADRTRSSRLGAVPASSATAGSGLTTPSLWGSSGPAFSITGGVGPLSGSFVFGWSGSVIDYMDMNGDGFPDVVTPNTITYTNPRGGRACVDDAMTVACDGGGASVIQKSTTLGVGAGLDGAPLGQNSNTKGRTNATQGNSTNKGGSASDKSYAANLGLSIGFSASWSNPNSADPSWQSQVKQAQLDKVPGEDPTKSGLATEQVLADINGDGLPDRIDVDPQGVFVKLNLGYGFSPNAVRWSAGGFESGESYSGSLGGGFSLPFYEFSGGVSGSAGVDFSRYAWADVNGDGLLDALHKNEREKKVEVAFGSGTGIGSKDNYGTTSSLSFDIFPGVPTDLSGQQIRQDQSQSIGGGADVTFGFPLCLAGCWLIVNPGGHFEQTLSMTDIDLQDVNGDGAPDSVRREPSSGASANHEKLNVRLNLLGKAGLLKKVTTPMGGTVALDYKRAGNTLEHPESMWVLADVKVEASQGNDGIADQRSTYEYGTPRYAFAQREDLGFDKLVESQLDESGATLRSIEHVYRNASVFDSGLETRTTVYKGKVSDGKPVQRTTTDWQVLNLMTNLPLSLENVGTDALLRLRAAPLVQGTTSTWFDTAGNIGQESSVRYEYDRLGNPEVIDDEGDPENPDDDVVARIRYSNCIISASYGLTVSKPDPDGPAFGCSDGFPAPDPDDADESEPVPATTAPTARAPYWSKDLCPTWTSVPAIISVRNADGNLVRYRDGAPDVCDNTSVTYLKEMVEEGPTIEDSTYAVTQLAYDDWGSYNRIIYPENEQGRSYAVFYVYDAKRRGDIAKVTDLSVDADTGGEFLDPTALGELAEDVGDADTTFTVTETLRAVRPPALPFEAEIGDELLRVTDRQATGDDNEWEYTVERGLDEDGASEHDAGADIAIATDQPQGDPTDPDQADLIDRLTELGEAGITASATFDGPTGRVSSRTDASGNVTRYDYDAFSRTKTITHPDGGSVSFEYAPTNAAYPYAVARHSDEFNNGTIDTATFVDGSGRVTGRKRDAAFFDGADKPTKTGWAVEGAEQVDALGRVVSQWYPTQQLTGALTDYWDKTPPEPPKPIRTEYDTLDRVVGERAANDAETKTEYGFGVLDGRRMATAKTTDPQGRVSLRFLDVRDYTRAVDDVAAGLATVRTRYDVDGLGQLHSVRSSPTEAIEHEYDVAGRRTSTTTPDGGAVTYEYDLPGNLVSKQTPKLRAEDDAIEYGYEFGHLVSVDYPDTTPDVRLKWGGYSGVAKGDNGGGRVVDVVDAARHQELGYDQHGNVDSETTTILNGRHPNDGPFKTTFDYDWLGRLASVTLPDAETVTNDYDAGGRLNNVSGAKSCTTLGTLTAAIDATQTTITVTETPSTGPPSLPFTIRIGGEQLRVTARTATADPSRWTYTVVRGINGTPEAPTNAAHGAGAAITSDTAFMCKYAYLDRREYDEFGSRVFEAVGNKVKTQYTREPDTRRLSMQVATSPAAPGEIQDLLYEYDLVGNVELAENNLPADVSSLFGGPTRQEHKYDTRYRIEHSDGTWDYAPKTRREYTYDVTYDQPSGNVTSIKQRDWTFDTACKNNCKEVDQPATTYDHSTISYDPVALHRFDIVGAPLSALKRDYDHDLNGNSTRVETATEIREVGWNADDRMTSIVDRNKSGSGRKETTFAYDYNGTLATEVKETNQTSFVNPWVTVRNSTMWKNIWADDDRLGTKFSQDDTYEEKLYFLHKDLQGSTNVVTDRTGKVFQHHEYFPSGDVWIDEASTVFRTPYQFAGGYADEDHNLIGLSERWYEPGVQAFTSVDPILTDDPMAIVEDPDLRTSYAYARNNPLTYVDVSGRRFGPVHVSLSSINALAASLKIDGQPLSQTEQGKLTSFFLKKSALRGRMAYYWLRRQGRNEARQKFAERWSTKPVLEFEFENGKLNKIKLGLGAGKRVRLLGDKSAPPSSSQTSTGTSPVGATGTAPPPSGGPPNRPPPPIPGGPPNRPPPPIPTGGGSSASAPVATGSTSAGGGNSGATTGGNKP